LGLQIALNPEASLKNAIELSEKVAAGRLVFTL
jgi:hypothetical protein